MRTPLCCLLALTASVVLATNPEDITTKTIVQLYEAGNEATAFNNKDLFLTAIAAVEEPFDLVHKVLVMQEGPVSAQLTEEEWQYVSEAVFGADDALYDTVIHQVQELLVVRLQKPDADREAILQKYVELIEAHPTFIPWAPKREHFDFWARYCELLLKSDPESLYERFMMIKRMDMTGGLRPVFYIESLNSQGLELCDVILAVALLNPDRDADFCRLTMDCRELDAWWEREMNEFPAINNIAFQCMMRINNYTILNDSPLRHPQVLAKLLCFAINRSSVETIKSILEEYYSPLMDKFLLEIITPVQMEKLMKMLRPQVILQSVLFGPSFTQMDEDGDSNGYQAIAIDDEVLQRWYHLCQFGFNKPALAAEIAKYVTINKSIVIPPNTDHNYFQFMTQDLIMKIVCECVAENSVHAFSTIPLLFPNFGNRVLQSVDFLKQAVTVSSKMASITVVAILEEKCLLPWSSRREFKKEKFGIFVKAVTSHTYLSLPRRFYGNAISKLIKSAKKYPFAGANEFQAFVSGCIQMAGEGLQFTLPECLSDISTAQVIVNVVKQEFIKRRFRLDFDEANRVLADILAPYASESDFVTCYEYFFAKKTADDAGILSRMIMCNYLTGTVIPSGTLEFVVKRSDFNVPSYVHIHDSILTRYLQMHHKSMPYRAERPFVKLCLKAVLKGEMSTTTMDDDDWLPQSLIKMAMDKNVKPEEFEKLLDYLRRCGISLKLILAVLSYIKAGLI